MVVAVVVRKGGGDGRGVGIVGSWREKGNCDGEFGCQEER